MEEIIKFIKVILIAYILITFISIIYIPAATDYRFPAWRGISVHKNYLGQISLVSLIVWSIDLVNKGFAKRATTVLFWCLSLVLLIGSKSTTNILAGTFLLCMFGFFYVAKNIFQPVIGKFLSYSFSISLLGCLSIIVFFEWEIIGSLFSFFGKDLTLTGRTYLWADIFTETKNHFLFGCGYGGFWIPKAPAIEALYQEYTWFPNEAHLGYLDVLNETGAIGLTLLIVMVVVYFVNMAQWNVNSSHWKWFVVAALILNIAESSFFLPAAITGDFFLLSYLALHTELEKGSRIFSI
jgi:O-antigen ligase